MTNVEIRALVEKTISALDAETLKVSIAQVKAKKYGYTNDKAVGLRGPGSLSSDSTALTAFLNKTKADSKTPEEKTKDLTEKIAEAEKKLADLKAELEAVGKGAVDDTDIQAILEKRASLVAAYDAEKTSAASNGTTETVTETAKVAETEDIPQ